MDSAAFSPSGPSPTVPNMMLTFAPSAVMGGAPSQGTVQLTGPAPSSPLVVSLQSGSAAVTVPPSVTIAAGAQSAAFPVTTTPVTADTTGSVTATMSGGRALGTLPVWAVLPNYVSLFSIGTGFPMGPEGFRRLTPASGPFTAYCQGSRLLIFVNGSQSRTLTFSAPTGTPLRPGNYLNTSRISTASRPGLDVGNCASSVGSFVVQEVQVDRMGTVRRFAATFEEFCTGGSADGVRGEVRVTDPPHGPSSPSACVVP
jgi:hypothetical protein